MAPRDRKCPPKYSRYVHSGNPVPFSSQRKKRVKQSIPATKTCYIWLRRVARGIISSQILLMVYSVKSETTLPRKFDPQQHIAHAFPQAAPCHFLTAVLKYDDHVQNNHSNLLSWASFHNLASSNLPVGSKVKSDVP